MRGQWVFAQAHILIKAVFPWKYHHFCHQLCQALYKAKRIISLVERRDPIISLFECMGNGVVFGKDTGYNEFQSDTLIAAKFTSDKYKGYIALIGPNRLSYEQLIPTIEYTAEKLSEVITAAQKDMED